MLIRPTPRRHRQGVTMVEIAIVVAIFGILAALGISALQPMLPSWRTRRAASEFASNVQYARQLAITEGTTYRVTITAMDNDLDNASSGSVGAYTIAAANPAGSAVEWDVLPLEDGGGDDDQSAGLHVFTEGTDEALRWVSIAPFDSSEPDDDAIEFDSRGMVANSSGDFSDDGTLDVLFVNKRARLEGDADEWTVCVTRGGMVRLSSGRNPGCVGTNGTAEGTSFVTSSGTGFTDDGSSAFGSSQTAPPTNSP